MSYTIKTHDKTFTIAVDTVDTSNTSLSLPGKDWSGWGEMYTQNMVNLLDNFANTTLNTPTNPATGQLFYDTQAKALKVWDQSLATWTQLNSQLASPVTITLSNATQMTGSVTFQGGGSYNLNATLVPTGVTVDPSTGRGTYTLADIVVDAYGRVVHATTNFNANTIANQTEVTSVQVVPNSSGTNPGSAPRIGAVSLYGGDVVAALGYTPYNASNPSGYISGINSGQVQAALGYTPLNKAGDFMTGQLNMNGQRIVNLGAPVGGADAARFQDVINVLNAKTAVVYNGSLKTGYSVTVSPNPPSGGSDGDVWYRY